MNVLGLGSIIEFNGMDSDSNKITGEAYVDIVTTVNLQLDGSAKYWTRMYPEVNGEEHEISPDRITRVVEHKLFTKPDNLPIIPFNIGDLISFIWDNEKRVYGIVSEAYNIIDKSGTYDWRMVVGEEHYYLCGDEEADYKIRIERVANAKT